MKEFEDVYELSFDWDTFWTRAKSFGGRCVNCHRRFGKGDWLKCNTANDYRLCKDCGDFNDFSEMWLPVRVEEIMVGVKV